MSSKYGAGTENINPNLGAGAAETSPAHHTQHLEAHPPGAATAANEIKWGEKDMFAPYMVDFFTGA